jgi:hypothetical protein
MNSGPQSFPSPSDAALASIAAFWPSMSYVLARLVKWFGAVRAWYWVGNKRIAGRVLGARNRFGAGLSTTSGPVPLGVP